MTTQDIAVKWNNIYTKASPNNAEAAFVLRENLHLLPVDGNALDLACGLGGNAMLLAQQGLKTHAWDISKTATDKLQKSSKERNITMQIETRDVLAEPPRPASFDVIVVTRFLERELMPALSAALRPDGLIYYQTFIKDKTADSGPQNPAYRLDKNELLDFFHSLQIIFYREEGSIGDLQRGFRNEAMLIARKTKSNG